MSILDQVIDAAADASVRSSVVESLAWQLYHQWRSDQLSGGHPIRNDSDEPSLFVMGRCFDEAEAWVKLAEQRRAAQR